MFPDYSNNSASSANFDIRNHIDQLTPNEKEKGKYICPACNGHNLSINLKTGKYNCWNCGDTQAIAQTLVGSERHTHKPKRSNKQIEQYVSQKKTEQQQKKIEQDLKQEFPDLTESQVEYHAAVLNSISTAVELDPAEKLKSDIQAYLLEKDPYARATIKTHILRYHGISRETLEGLIIETAIGSQSKQLSIFSGAQFLNSDIEPVQFLVQGVPIGGTTILAGSSGSGKTTLAYWLGKCVLDGNEFLGDTPSTTGGIIIVNSDEGASSSLDRMIDMSYPEDDRWMFLRNFKLDYHFEQLEELVRDRQPKLLIVDSFCGIHGEAFEENSSIAGITVEKFNRLAETYNCAIVMIHHLNKAGELRGSSRIKDTAYSVLLIEENKDGTRQYKSKKIRCASTFDYILKLDIEGIPMVCQGGESKMHLNIKEIILGCLQASPQPLEPAEISGLTQLSKQQVWDGLKKLRDTGKAKCRRSQRDKRAKVWMPTTVTPHTPPSTNEQSSKIAETLDINEVEPSKNILDPSGNLTDLCGDSSIENSESSIESSIVNPLPEGNESEIARPLSEIDGECEVKGSDSSASKQQEKLNPVEEYYTLKSGDFVFGNYKLFQLKEKHQNMWFTFQGIYVSYADWLAGSFRKPTENDIKFLLCQMTDKLQLEFLVKHFQSVVFGQLLEELPPSVSEQILDLDWD
ncbi:MAG: AAA family ATPase [Cyanobacteria bacterium J06592_8]